MSSEWKSEVQPAHSYLRPVNLSKGVVCDFTSVWPLSPGSCIKTDTRRTGIKNQDGEPGWRTTTGARSTKFNNTVVVDKGLNISRGTLSGSYRGSWSTIWDHHQSGLIPTVSVSHSDEARYWSWQQGAVHCGVKDWQQFVKSQEFNSQVDTL